MVNKQVESKKDIPESSKQGEKRNGKQQTVEEVIPKESLEVDVPVEATKDTETVNQEAYVPIGQHMSQNSGADTQQEMMIEETIEEVHIPGGSMSPAKNIPDEQHFTKVTSYKK